MTRKRALIFFSFLCLCCAVRGQSVGLVLSGGGAKGLYHIGVIRALEENGIPIDYITGTSMGSIVGGLYAIGYSPQEMERIAVSSEMNYWVTGRVEAKYKYYFKQMQSVPETFTVRLDFKDRGNVAKIRPNIIPSSQIDMAFAGFFAPATQYTGGDFDLLFVPFRCIATDATNRREVDFRRGDLGKAVRASMAIPFIYSPMQIDSALLYDGGLFNNFPWRTMRRDFNPGFIIGSSVSSPDENLDNQASIIDYAMSITMLHSDYRFPKENSALIQHKFTNVSAMDFHKADEIIQTGYEDAMASMDSIRTVIGRRVDSTEVAARRQAFKDRLIPLVFEDYRISGLSESQESYVRRLLKIRRGQAFTMEDFRSEYFKLLSEGDIEGSYPDIGYNPTTGKYILSMHMTAKPSFKLMIGGNVSSTALNQAYIGLEYKEIGSSARSYHLNAGLSPFYTTFNPGASIDFFVRSPMRAEFGLFTNYYNYFRSNYGFLSKDHDLTYLKSEDNYLTLALGFPVERQSVLFLRGNAGIDNYQYSLSNVVDESDELDRTRFKFIDAKLELERKDTNYSSYPTRGIYQSISAMAVTGQESYRPGTEGSAMGYGETDDHHAWAGAKFIREHYFPVKNVPWFSWGYMIDATATTHRSFSNESASNFTSPGFTPTAHSKIVYLKEFHSDSYLAGGLMPTFEFTNNFFLKSSIYAYAPRDYNKVKEGIPQKVRYIFDASLVYRTVAGPISISLSKYDVSRNNWFITFNFGHPLFHPKGTFY